MDKIIVSPSILSLDPSLYRKEISILEQAGAKWIHLDVMDGRFVQATTFGPEVVERLRPFSKSYFDVHLMVEDPLRVIPSFCLAGADGVTFHLEACKSLLEARQCIDLIHSFGKKAGSSVKPSTPMESLFPFWADLDLALVMSVEPGKGGQKFLPSCLKKLEAGKAKNIETGRNVFLEVDGGINDQTAPLAVRAGASVLVAGSYLCGHDDVMKRMKGLLEL